MNGFNEWLLLQAVSLHERERAVHYSEVAIYLWEFLMIGS